MIHLHFQCHLAQYWWATNGDNAKHHGEPIANVIEQLPELDNGAIACMGNP